MCSTTENQKIFDQISRIHFSDLLPNSATLKERFFLLIKFKNIESYILTRIPKAQFAIVSNVNPEKYGFTSTIGPYSSSASIRSLIQLSINGSIFRILFGLNAGVTMCLNRFHFESRANNIFSPVMFLSAPNFIRFGKFSRSFKMVFVNSRSATSSVGCRKLMNLKFKENMEFG